MTADLITLIASVACLRADERALNLANNMVLAHGIGGHGVELAARLDQIKAEAHRIADQLDALGATVAAEEARTGWPIVVHPEPIPPRAVATATVPEPAGSRPSLSTMDALVPGTVVSLTGRVALLRTAEQGLILANAMLLSKNIIGHFGELLVRLGQIKADAHQLADQLDALGAPTIAANARQGWAPTVGLSQATLREVYR